MHDRIVKAPSKWRVRVSEDGAPSRGASSVIGLPWMIEAAFQFRVIKEGRKGEPGRWSRQTAMERYAIHAFHGIGMCQRAWMTMYPS